MSGLFGGDKPKQPEPIPQVAHEEVQAAGDAERRKRRAAAGRASTLLVSGQTTQANVGTAQLLGR